MEITELAEGCRGWKWERGGSRQSWGMELEIGVQQLEVYDDTGRWVNSW